MNFFLSQHLADPALAVWNRQQSLGLPVHMADAVPLVDALIDANRTIQATQIWKQALRDQERQKPLRANNLSFLMADSNMTS